MEPRSRDLDAETLQPLRVEGHRVVREVSAYHSAEPLSLDRYGQVASPKERLADLLQLRPQSVLHRVPKQHEPPRPRLPADVREAQEVEGFRLAMPTLATPLLGEPAEAQQPRLVRVELEPEMLEAPWQLRMEPPGVDLVLESQHDIVGVPDYVHRPSHTSCSPLLDPEVEHVVKIHIREERRDRRSLRCALFRRIRPTVTIWPG